MRLVLGPVAVTIFNTVRTLIRSSSQAFAMLYNATYPDFQFELNAGKKEKAIKIFLGTLGANVLIAIVFVIGIGLFGETIYNIWTNKVLTVPVNVWVVFAASVLFYALWYTFSFIFEALNKPYTYTLASLVCDVIAIFVSWFLCLKFGLIGAALGNLSFDVLMCIYLLPIGAKVIEMSVFGIIGKSFMSVKQMFYDHFLSKNNS